MTTQLWAWTYDGQEEVGYYEFGILHTWLHSKDNPDLKLYRFDRTDFRKITNLRKVKVMNEDEKIAKAIALGALRDWVKPGKSPIQDNSKWRSDVTHDELLAKLDRTTGYISERMVWGNQWHRALRAVVELHKPNETGGCSTEYIDCHSHSGLSCDEYCNTYVAYPCPTVQAISARLGVE
jgi:hypothetical protein